MNKQAYLLILLLFIVSISAIAQPSIEANAVPKIGLNIPGVYYEGDLEMGDNGPNKTWVFEANPSSGTAFTNYKIIPVEDAKHSELFPGAEMVLWLDNLDVYNFLRVVDNKLQSLGFAFGNDDFGLFYTKLQDGETIGTWPLTYGDTFESETMYETYLGFIAGGLGTRKRIATADSYGIVTTPYGTFEDVLKISIDFQDSLGEIDQVIFLHPSSLLPLVSYDISNYDGLNPGYFFLDLSGLSTSTEELNQEDYKISVNDKTISIAHQENAITGVELYSLNGSLIPMDKDMNRYTTSIHPANDLTTGMYILQIIKGSKVSSNKIFIP